MARESGQYRQMLLEQQERGRFAFFAGGGENTEIPWFRIRFYVSLVLFLCYVLLDYTGAKLYTLDSGQILAQIQKDMTKELHVDTMLARMMEQIEITDEGLTEENPEAGGEADPVNASIQPAFDQETPSEMI